MNELEKARIEIDRIDRQVASLFEERMHVVAKVAEYKRKTGKPIFDEARENEVIEKNSQLIEDKDLVLDYKQFLKDFMNVSKKYQSRLLFGNKIGYQGVKGAFSHISATRLFPNSTLNAYNSFADVIEAVENGEIDAGVLPFENSTTGEVGEVMDLLFKHHDVFVNAIYDLEVRQNLLAKKSTQLADIKTVYSHQQALDQSKPFLAGTNWQLVPYPNTALAAKFVSESEDNSIAAIASKETAQLYNLNVLAENINSSAVNTTRFAIVTKQQSAAGEKFGIFFTVTNAAGSLAKVINIISKTGYNMSCLRSRSMKDLPWEYYFYVEASGSLADETGFKMIEELKEVTGYLHIIGAFSKIVI